MSGEFALGGLTEGVRRAFGGGATSDVSAFLNPASAERLARRLASMRGAAMKIGQMLSLADDSLIPPEFSEALSILRASADSMPPSQVKKTLVAEFGADWSRRFQSFDLEPIAAASIGQVHTAVASDGRELALKIQYPGVAESIDSDVDNLATAIRAARILPVDLGLDGIIEEAKAQLQREADYLLEADYLRSYQRAMAGDPRFVVPDVHPDLTTTRILAMDRLHGLPLEDLVGPEHARVRRDQVCAWLLELLFRELFQLRLMQTDPNFSNYLLLSDGRRLGLLDFGSTREIEPELSDRYRELLAGVHARDRDRLREASIAIGFLQPDDPEPSTRGLIDLLELFFEPLGYEGVYDFAGADFLARTRDAGIALVFRHGFMRTPPPRTIFLQRKLEGTLMLCSRLRARVDVHALLGSFLLESARSPRV